MSFFGLTQKTIQTASKLIWNCFKQYCHKACGKRITCFIMHTCKWIVLGLEVSHMVTTNQYKTFKWIILYCLSVVWWHKFTAYGKTQCSFTLDHDVCAINFNVHKLYVIFFLNGQDWCQVIQISNRLVHNGILLDLLSSPLLRERFILPRLDSG